MATKNNKWLEQYRDPRWQKKRLEVMQRDNFTCRKCGNKEKTLNVHHRRYISDFEFVWEYENYMLITLCEDCHKEETENMAGAIAYITEVSKDFLFSEGVANLADVVFDIFVFNQNEDLEKFFAFASKNPEFLGKHIREYFDNQRRENEGEKNNG